MALTDPEGCTAEDRYRYLSSLIIDEVLNNIASSLSTSSSIDPITCDAADSAIGKLVWGSGGDEVSDAEKMMEDARRMPVGKKVTFSKDVIIVSYEEASQGEAEKTDDAPGVTMEDDEEKESVRISKEEHDLGSSSCDEGDFIEKITYFDADGNLLKRKCSDSDLEDKCIIPNKMIRPEADSAVSQQNEQYVNEGKVKATGSHLLDDKSEEKVGADKVDVEVILEVSKSPNICVAVTQDEEERDSANRAVSTSLCYPSDMDCTVRDTRNPTVHSLSQKMDNAADPPLSKPSEDIMDDCRSVLQSVVDNTVHHMVLNTKLDEDIPNTDEKPPLKKMKSVSVPPSDPDTTESFIFKSTVPGFQINKEMESVPSGIPRLSNPSTTDVEQLYVSENIKITAYIMEAESSCDNLSLDLCLDTEREHFHRVTQVAAESAGVSTSTEDVMEDKDVEGERPMIKETVASYAKFSPYMYMYLAGRESPKSYNDLQVVSDSTDVSTSTEDVMEDTDGDSPMIKDVAEVSPPESVDSCTDFDPDLSGRDTTDGYGDVQVPFDSTVSSDKEEDEDEDKIKDIDAAKTAETPPAPNIPVHIRENKYMSSNTNFHKQATPYLSSPDVEVVEDIHNIAPRRTLENTCTATEATETPSPPTACITSHVIEDEYQTSNNNLYRQDASCLSTIDVEEVEVIQNLIPRGDPKAYSSILAQDLYLDDSVDYPDQSKATQFGMHDDEEYGSDTFVPSSADVEVVKPDDVYVEVIEPSFREDIMPSPGSCGDDFGCTFQKASQVLISSQNDSHPLIKLDGFSRADSDLQIPTDDLQVPAVVSIEPVGEEPMNNEIECDWDAKLPFHDNIKSKALEVPALDLVDIVHQPLNNNLTGKSKAKDTHSDIPEHQFLDKTSDQRKPGSKETLLNHVVNSSIVHQMHGIPEHPVENSEGKSSKLSRIEAKGTNDQTVPSLRTSIKGDPCIDHLLDLEESIFSEQETKDLEGPMKQSILVSEDEPFIEVEEAKPIPDHLKTLGQNAAGVFQWKHSPSLTPCPANTDQSTLQCSESHLDQSTPITPVRPLPACQRKRRVGLSRRQLVYPLHSKTFPKK